MAYPLSSTQIEDWARSINELRPNQDIGMLRKIINMMKIGGIEFNSREGIQNIFKALREYDPLKIGYIMRQPDINSMEMQYDIYENTYSTQEDMVWTVDKDEYLARYLKPKSRNPQLVY